jgi:predicted ATP-dependent serine protease
MKTGISVIDNALPEGLSNDKINIIGTRCGMGKTTLCGRIAITYAEAGKNVLFLSAEERVNEIRRKILHTFFGHDKYNWETVKGVSKNFGILKIRNYGYAPTTSVDLLNMIKSYEINFDLIILDGINFIDAPLAIKTFNDNVSSVVVSTSQLARLMVNGNFVNYPADAIIDEKINNFIFDVKSNENGYKVGPVYLNKKNIGEISYNIFGEVKNN